MATTVPSEYNLYELFDDQVQPAVNSLSFVRKAEPSKFIQRLIEGLKFQAIKEFLKNRSFTVDVNSLLDHFREWIANSPAVKTAFYNEAYQKSIFNEIKILEGTLTRVTFFNEKRK